MTSYYFDGGTQGTIGNAYSSYATIQIDGNANWGSGTYVSGELSVKSGISPILAFKYIKKKFGILEKSVLDRRLARLEKAFMEAVDNGQEALGEKILKEVARETRESALYAKGIRNFVERDDISKVKNKIRDGHISDTKLQDYTKHIPKKVIEKKKATEGLFDGYVIYHYYNTAIEDKIVEKQKMSPDEKAKMRDPILFGWIKECNRLYFIADWEDEHCDLTFDEMIGVIGKQEKLTKMPELVLDPKF